MLQAPSDRVVRLTKVAALGLVAGLLLTGCGRDPGASGDAAHAEAIASGPATGTIELWAQGGEAELLPDFVKGFEKENPDAKVNVTAIPWEAGHAKYQAAIAGRTTPDLAQMGTTWMTDFGHAFEPTPAEVDTSGFLSSSVRSTEVDGTAVGVPWYVDTRVFFYRKDLAEQAGYTEFPTTWEGLTDFAKAVKAQPGVEYPLQLPVSGDGAFQMMLPFLWSNGAEFITEDNSEWTFDTPEIVEAFEYYQGLFEQELASKNPNTGAGAGEAAFVNGTSPVLIAGPGLLGQLNAAGGPGFEDEYMVAQIPKKVTGTSFIGGSNLAVFKDAKNRDGAWKLAQWFSKPEVQAEWYELSGSLPAVESVWQDPVLADDEKLAVFGEQLKDTNFPPTISTWIQVSGAADSQLEQMVRAGKDPAVAMKELQATADSIGTGD